MPELIDHRAQLTQVCGRLHRLGYVPGSSGNVSLRADDRSFLITPSAISLGDLQPGDFVQADLNGETLGDGRPSSEVGIHALIYRARPAINSVVHTHCAACTAFAMARQDFGEPCSLEIYSTVGVPVLVPFAPPGEWGPCLEPALQDADCFLLSNHGVVTLGATLKEAANRMEEVENFARSLIFAKQLGGAAAFTDRELDRIHAFLDRIGVPRPRSASRSEQGRAARE